MVYMVMAYIVMTYIVMAYIVMAQHWRLLRVDEGTARRRIMSHAEHASIISQRECVYASAPSGSKACRHHALSATTHTHLLHLKF